ncbi:class I SAM-dependent DNA methyltransferase [Diaphorobacter aerolatus]|uniref:Methyltransferase domain-containing protein n=1 Tax=Diaphorobacter aerolatus TaxID=1288495 RepID=A0A7H0GLH9_9BURK|nr:SAM-dependent methyltransferase [Diaphorobacter aerolatus]QNP49145.1 methyltransferase domain-containing protein [Diaphorobacter aerolatus]
MSTGMRVTARPDFDVPHRDADPWGYERSWYEERRRMLTLASLVKPRFSHVLELGCSTGRMTAHLAARAERVTAVDISPVAIDKARARLPDVPHIDWQCADLTQHWPEGRFDAVLLCDIGYYWSEAELRGIVGHVAASAADDAMLLAAHWRHPFEQATISTQTVHACIAGTLPWQRYSRSEDPDLLIEVWRSSPLSIAREEGLV